MRLLSIIASVLLLAVGSVGQTGSCSYWNTNATGADTLVDYPNTGPFCAVSVDETGITQCLPVVGWSLIRQLHSAATFR